MPLGRSARALLGTSRSYAEAQRYARRLLGQSPAGTVPSSHALESHRSRLGLLRSDSRIGGKTCSGGPASSWEEGLAEWRSSPACAARSLGRTQGASISIDMGATEDAASGRAACAGGTAVISPNPPGGNPES